MAEFVLPNIQTGGTIRVQANNLQEAQQTAANQTGVSLGQQQAGGTFGVNTNSSLGGGGGSSSGGGASSGGDAANLQAAQLAAQVANNSALMAYYNAKLAQDSDQLAFNKAQQAWQNTYDTETRRIQTEQKAAELTGTYQGQPTLATDALLGSYQPYAPGSYLSDPGTGAVYSVGPTGQISYIGDPRAIPAGATIRSVPGLGGPVQTATGWVPASLPNGQTAQPTLEAQRLQQETAQNYLTLISQLRGPADYGQYLRVLGSTPGGLRDLVSAAAGQYNPASGATTGAQPQAASLGSTLGQVGGAGTTYADFQAAATGLPAPNQISPTAYNSMTSTQRSVLGSLYEGQGYNVQDVADLYKQSLPKYAGPTNGSYKLV